MTTKTEALNWVDKQLGKSLDFDKFYGAQCVDLVAYYCTYLAVSPHRGNARYWWESGYNGGGQFDRVSSPQEGDIVVFKPNAGNGNAGHIAIVRELKGGSFRSLDQNWFNANSTVGSPAAWVTHAIDANIYGYLRPKFTNKEEVPLPNDGDIINMKRAETGVPDYQPTGLEFDFYKDPKNGWNRLAYDTIAGMQARINQLQVTPPAGVELKPGTYYVK